LSSNLSSTPPRCQPKEDQPTLLIVHDQVLIPFGGEKRTLEVRSDSLFKPCDLVAILEELLHGLSPFGAGEGCF
jgi:hypothetical protein